MKQFCNRDPNTIALLLGDIEVSFGEIYSLADEISRELKGAFQPGERLLVSSKGVLPYVACMFAFYELDLVFCCWNGETDKTVLAGLIGASGFITTEKEGGFSLNRLHTNRSSVTIDDKAARGDLILTTSGSTGSPKGVLLCTENVIQNALLAGKAIGLYDATLRRWCINIDFSLMSAISHMFMAWHGNLPLKSMCDFNSEAIITEFKDGDVGFGGAPLQLSVINQYLTNSPEGIFLVSSGDFLTRQIVENIALKNPAISVASFYGLTELSGRFCYMTATDIQTRPGSAGRAIIPGSLRLKDSKVITNSSLLFEGYFKKTQGFEAHHGDFDTGDLGYFDEDGYLWLEGRANDTFKVSGIKVNRKIIEETLADSGILHKLNFVVLPVPHDTMGTCCALFVAHPSDANKPSLKDIVSVIKAEHPSTHIPVYSYSVESMPTLKNGKIDKQYLIANHLTLERYR